jgi:hypothetical protein
VYPKAQDKEWKESLALSGGVVSPSGEKKTPAWKTFLNPVFEQDIDWRKQYDRQMAEYKKAHDTWEKSKKEGPEPVEPGPPRRAIVNDATPEKLHELMEENPSGVLYYRDELSSWVTELDKKGYEAQRGLFLAAMNGDDIYGVDRIGRGTVNATMCASVFGSFQPEMLRDFMGQARNIADGMIPRFALLVWPDQQTKVYADRTANVVAKQRFRDIVRKLASLKPESIAFHFNSEAQVVFTDWHKRLDKRIAEQKQQGRRSHLSKYAGVLPRIAALFQLVDLVANAAPVVTDVSFVTDAASHGTVLPNGFQLIDREHLEKAIRFVSYLESHMHRVYESVLTPTQIAERALVEHLTGGHLTNGFSIRDIRRKHWTGLTSPDDIEMALDNLEDKGWVRAVEQAAKTRGRPTVKWDINPNLNK